ncbi:MAG: FtsX-like permease family protein [Acidimicrobiales bacterium]
MIRLGLRLTLGSGREARARVLVTAAAVALGVALLLAALAGVNGLHAQTDRGAWLDTSAQASHPTSTSHGLWWLSSVDQFDNQAIDRIDVAAAGRDAPVPPGISHLPGPGEYYASPALTALFESEPANELRDRYPGHQIGTLGAAALPSPNSLIIVIGHSARQLSQIPDALEVGAIQRTPASCYNCQNANGSGSVLEFILAVGAIALLLPMLILIATASRLSAARREERFAAMRLIGATPYQISVVSAVEAAVAALTGVAVGFALFFVLRPLLYHVSFTGVPFLAGDLSLHWIDVALAVIGVPLAAVVSARLALRRVQVSPLGVSRRVSSRAPRITRIIPLAAGIALLAYFDAAGKPGNVGSQLLELLVGFTLLVVGLVLAGPWFTTAGSRLMVKRAKRPAALLAGRRLLDNPKAAFRFISGLVIALFIASALIGALSSIATASSAGGGSTAGSNTLADPFCSFSTSNCPASAKVASVSDRVLAELRSTPGVRSVTLVHQNPQGSLRFSLGPSRAPLRNSFGIVACDQLAKTPAIGRCAPGASVADVGYFLSNVLGHNSHASTTVWPSANMSVEKAAKLPVVAVVIATNGSSSSIERARTALELAFPYQGTPVAVDAFDPSTARLLAMVQDMTDVMIVASLIIAACSLAVNIAAGLGGRKRPFSLLRLTGVPTSLLHRVVALESVLPLFIVAGVSIVVGLLSAALYLHSQVGIAFRTPGISYWATVLGGLCASLAIIAATFPLLNRMTGPEVARND